MRITLFKVHVLCVPEVQIDDVSNDIRKEPQHQEHVMTLQKVKYRGIRIVNETKYDKNVSWI